MRQKKTLSLLFLTIFISISIIRSIYASSANVGTRLDISGGFLSGQHTNFRFYVPKDWRGIIFAESGDLTDSANEAERIDFYCLSDSGKSKPLPLLSLYVFSVNDYKSDYLDKFGGTVILRTTEYVFAVSYYSAVFNNKQDRLVYNQMFESAKNADRLQNCIVVANETLLVKQARIYINNAVTTASPQIIDGLHFIPLRAVCEALNCRVNWYSSSSLIEIFDNAGWYDSFKVTSPILTDSRGIKIRLIDDRTYVQSAYFTRIMKKSVEIDADGNVFIYK